MSVNDLPPSADPTISHTSQPHASDLEALDNRLKRLSEDVFPLHPYLLTLPTNTPFRLNSRSANNWAVGHDRPFTSDEQQLQYMTFLTHDSGDSLLLAVGDWSDESGRMMADRPRTTTTSLTENPRDAVSKKKISLKDYNTQKVTSTSVATPTPPPPENHSRERSAHANKREGGAKARATTPTPDLTISNDKLETRSIPTKSQSQQRSLSPTKDSHSSKKRPSASYSDFNSHSHPPKGSEIMHSPKKPRLSPEKDQRMETSPAKTSRSPRLPALLSPTLPPTSGPRLPRLLSPTLPPDIEKELAKIGGHSPGHTSPKRETAAIRTKRNDELHQSRAPASTSGNSGSNSSQQSGGGRAGTSSKDKDSALPNPTRRIVSLKYGKSNRKRVEALLKFSGKKKAYPTNSTTGADTDPDDVSHAHLERRREREDLSQPRNNVSSKKIKSKARHEADETLGSGSGSAGARSRDRDFKTSADKPSTPAFHPPSHDKPKQNTLTPVKDLKNMASRHGEHGDGDGKTPINPTSKRYSTDLGVRESPSQPESRPRDSDRRAWRDEFQKFSSIGRELKHASERYTAMTGPSTADEKLSVVTAIEAILSFILAFVADNQCKSLARQISDSSSWVSILAYWRVVRKKSTPYPVLHGLSLFLGAVSYDAIHALDLERLAVSPLPGEHTPAPTPGAGGGDNSSHHPTPAPSDDYKKAWEKISELRNRLPECYRESQKLWLEGSRGLSEDVLTQGFPNTWSRRSHNYAERGRIPLRAGEYAGDYFLPLGGTTQPIEIVRFSWSILHEWCEQEGIHWNERLVL